VQDELRRAIDTLPGLVWSARPDGTVDFLNQRWCDYTGVSRQDGCAWGWLTTVHAEDRAELADYWRSLLAAGEPGEAEARLCRCDGQFRWFLIRAVPLRDEGGNIVKWYGQNTDIEDRKRAEALLAGEKQLLEMAASGATLADVLEAVCRLVEKTDAECHCSILLIDDDGTTVRHVAAPTLPPEFTRGIDGQDVAPPYWGPCAMAVARKAQVIVPDIATETTWRGLEWCGLALRHGLKSCWTTPILSKAGDAFGTFAIYRREVGGPNRLHTELIEQVTHIASIAIERAQAEETLKRSQAHLARAQRLSTTGSFSYRAATDELTLSEETCRICGFDPTAPVPPGAMRDRIHPEDLPLFLRMLRGAGRQLEFDCRLQLEDGAIKYVHVVADAVRNNAGDLVEWIGAIRDVTDRKRVEDELRQSEAFLAEAQRLSSTGSFCWRVAKGEIIWSEQTYRIYDLDPNLPVTFDLVGTRIHPEEASWFQDVLGRASSEGRDLEFEHRLQMPDHSVRYLHVVAHATRSPDGELEYIGAVQDVTDRRRSEDALNKLRSELAHMGRVSTLGALTASIAHEVNQPLSGIITNASTSLLMLADDPPDIAGALESAQRTIRDANRASEVITRLRALFKKTSTASESLDLNEATREVLALSLSELQRGQVVVRTELADDLLPVRGDRVQLQQVILNLVLNATEAMSAIDDRPRQLLVRTERDEGDHVRLTVRDTGRGFDPQSSNRLFETFYTTKHDGMGIGLSISRSIIERHQGRLWGAGHDGPGATFAFSIPRFPVLGRAPNIDDPPAIAVPDVEGVRGQM